MKEFIEGERVFDKRSHRRGVITRISSLYLEVRWDDHGRHQRQEFENHQAKFYLGRLRKKESYPKEINDAVDRLLEEYGEPSETDELELDESKRPHRVWINCNEDASEFTKWNHSSYRSREDAKTGGSYNSKQVEFLEITDYVLECLVKGGFRYCK